jgi:cholesterol transport system auxiliary component
MHNYKYLFLLSFLCAGLGACNLLPAQRDPPSVFDLGVPPVYAANPHRIDATLLIPPVNASAWLDNTGIHYRLNYQNASQPEAYAQNRWVMTPAQLLTERLRARYAAASRGVLTAQDGAKADYALRIELEDFSQSFDAAHSSKGGVRLRASLIDQNSRGLQAQKTFSAERPAAPNAPGAAQALAAASDAVVEELFVWTAQTLNRK